MFHESKTSKQNRRGHRESKFELQNNIAYSSINIHMLLYLLLTSVSNKRLHQYYDAKQDHVFKYFLYLLTNSKEKFIDLFYILQSSQ